MFKKLLALLTFSVALVQPVYADAPTPAEMAESLTNTIKILIDQYNSGDKEKFYAVEKALLEENTLPESLTNRILAELYSGTKQFKKARSYYEYIIDSEKKTGKKDSDLIYEYINLARSLIAEGDFIRAQHYFGIACDNGDQNSCELYKQF